MTSDDTEATLDSRHAEQRAPRARAALVRVFDGEQDRVTTRVHPLDAPVIELGRKVEGLLDVEVADKRVSRRHLAIRPSLARRVLDVEIVSERGARLNGEPVTGTFEARHNDVLRVGHSLFVVRMEVVDDAAPDVALPGLFGSAPAMASVRKTLHLVGSAGRDLPVLLLGESGTGKEVAARAYASVARANGSFVAVNCGAIPDSLAESELFGHVAGAFTGAQRDHPGVFRRAHGGTLFLDEIGELPLALQPKLLRALEQREVTPVGGKAPVAVDVRVVSATNRDLRADIEQGAFRGDLYARLAGIVVALPPLRERREDVLPLFAADLGDAAPPLEVALAEALLLYAYPFNVRELKKLAAELSIRGQGRPRLTLDLVEDRLQPELGATLPASSPPMGASAHASRTRKPPSPSSEKHTPADAEELKALLREHGDNVSAIARATGRSRMQVYRWLKKHGLSPKGAASGEDAT